MIAKTYQYKTFENSGIGIPPCEFETQEFIAFDLEEAKEYIKILNEDGERFSNFSILIDNNEWV